MKNCIICKKENPDKRAKICGSNKCRIAHQKMLKAKETIYQKAYHARIRKQKSRTRICNWEPCSKEFKTKDQSKCCSDECKADLKRLRNREYAQRMARERLELTDDEYFYVDPKWLSRGNISTRSDTHVRGIN